MGMVKAISVIFSGMMLLVSVLFSSLSSAEIYRCIDDEGDIRFSTTPCGQESKPYQQKENRRPRHDYEKVRDLMNGFSCDSFEEGLSLIPDSGSMGILARDYANNREQLNAYQEKRQGRDSGNCQVKISDTLSHDTANIQVSIKSNETIKTKRQELLERLIYLGYEMERKTISFWNLEYLFKSRGSWCSAYLTHKPEEASLDLSCSRPLEEK